MEVRKYPSIRRKVSFLRHTPFHPQWFAFRHQGRNLKHLGETVTGRVLDIGCSDQHVRQYLDRSCYYVGIDYYQTATRWYKSRPQIYADAQQLPFDEDSFDSVLLLDVLEHLPEPKSCIAEICRVLKPAGRFILQVPFIYPIHDAPLDFQRWTIHGLYKLMGEYGFEVIETRAFGEPLETAALLKNIALSRTLIESVTRKTLFAAFVIFLPFSVFINNVSAWIFTLISPGSGMMPHGYQLVCV